MLYDSYKHSASSGNLWIDNQSAFLWRYGFKNWGKESPRANMGKAAEQAVYGVLSGGIDPAEAGEAATAIFDKMHQGEVHEEREAAGIIAGKMIAKLTEIGGTNTQKPREARSVPGLLRKINLAPDLYNSEVGIIDLKATLKMAWGDGKEPNPHRGHVRQQGLYSNLENGTPVSLLYATPKRCEFVTLKPAIAKTAADEILDAFGLIERWADAFPTPERAARMIQLNIDTYHWDDDETVASAQKLWHELNHKEAA